jgi:hypothetical protein
MMDGIVSLIPTFVYADAECRKLLFYAECHHAECNYSECRGSTFLTEKLQLLDPYWVQCYKTFYVNHLRIFIITRVFVPAGLSCLV